MSAKLDRLDSQIDALDAQIRAETDPAKRAELTKQRDLLDDQSDALARKENP